MAEQTVSGTVKWYDEEKGFGFIRQEALGDVYVHQSAFIDDERQSLFEGQRVTMEVIPNPRGFQAANVALDESEYGPAAGDRSE